MQQLKLELLRAFSTQAAKLFRRKEKYHTENFQIERNTSVVTVKITMGPLNWVPIMPRDAMLSDT